MTSRKEYHKEWYKKNRDRQRAGGSKHYQENKDYYKQKARQWEKENPERHQELQNDWRRTEKGKQQSRDWDRKNPEKRKAMNKAWKDSHPAERRESCRTRQAAKLQRTPVWADQAATLSIYEECERRNQETGIKHVVDHIIPLQGERASGLHVASNLQILTEQENLSKGNKLLEIS